MALDRGRILLTGSHLWQRDKDVSLNDFDYALTRLKGDSIFTDGHEF